MILIREIDRNPHSPSVAAYQTIVDQALALCSPSGGLTVTDRHGIVLRPLNDGGSEAWDLINRLRARVWTKCGADPDILPSRQEVVIRAKERAAQLLASDDTVGEGAEDLATFSEPPTSSQIPSVQPQRGDSLSEEDIVIGGGPTPNIDWTEWENMFGSQEGGDLSFIFNADDGD
jgi:hypothetical protein